MRSLPHSLTNLRYGSTPLSLASFEILRRAPTSTLFPYTTLFRSPHRHDWTTARGCTTNPRPTLASARPSGPIGAAVSQDRKSTRLNSSHLVSSYAVFCWKKQKDVRVERRPGQRLVLLAKTEKVDG